jgi:hypothetical protein
VRISTLFRFNALFNARTLLPLSTSSTFTTWKL